MATYQSFDSLKGDGHWSDSTDPDVVLAVPSVARRLEEVRARAPAYRTPEEVYQRYQWRYQIGMRLGYKLARSLGFRVSKTEERQFGNSPGFAIAAVVCAVAGRSSPVERMENTAAGFVLESKYPMSMHSFEADIQMVVKTDVTPVVIQVTCAIPGLLFDVGRCQSRLDDMFLSIRNHRRTIKGRAQLELRRELRRSGAIS